MDMLDQLDAGVDKLVQTLAESREENMRLRGNLAALEKEKTDLAEENQKLRAVIAREVSLRKEALTRIEILLSKIQEHDSVA